MYVPINNGRLFERKISGDAYAMVGYVQLDDLEPLEGPSYLVTFFDGYPEVHEYEKLSKSSKPSAYNISNVDNLLTEQVWNSVTCDLAGSSRFIPVLPEEGCFILYSASNRPLFSSLYTSMPDDCWVDIKDQTLFAIEAPIKTQGMKLNQVLSEPIWPHYDGRMFALNGLTTAARENLLAARKLMFSYIDQQLSEAEYKQKLHSAPEVNSMITGRYDEQYHQFLKTLRAHCEQQGMDHNLFEKPYCERAEHEVMKSLCSMTMKEVLELPSKHRSRGWIDHSR